VFDFNSDLEDSRVYVPVHLVRIYKLFRGN